MVLTPGVDGKDGPVRTKRGPYAQNNVWLEVTVRDDKGKIIFASDGLDSKGALPENTRIFNSDGMGSDFHFSVHPWVITAFSRHDTIPPRGYKDVFYGISAPTGVTAVTIEAKLRNRQADQHVAEELLGAVPKDINLAEVYGLTSVPTLPVVDMVVKDIGLDVVKK